MKTFKRLLSYIKPYNASMWLAVLCMILFSICNIIIIPLVGKVSEAIGNKDFATLNIIIAAGLGIYFLRGIVAYGQGYLMQFIGHRVVTDIRMQVYKHMQDLSLDFFAKWRTGEIIL